MEPVLANFEPKRVLFYFEEICRIPHGSGNTKELSDYCVDFAQKHNLRFHQDEVGNVIIWKAAAPGYEGADAIILQGHLDMVAEKTPESSHDFLKDPLDLFVEDGWIGAKDTTLGGDDGIAVAMCLALLEDDTLAHPALECVFTVEEETGMDGAKALDMSLLSGNYLINLDSEEEGTVLTSCAGGMRKYCTLPVRRREISGQHVVLTISGLQGGHSGAEIHKERGNANILMGRVLYEISRQFPMLLVSLAGGRKENVIPFHCEASFITEEEALAEIQNLAVKLEKDLSAEFDVEEPNLKLTCELKGEETVMAVSPTDTTKVLFFLVNCPNGVQAMSHHIAGLVETSLNLGVLELKEDEMACHFSVRSSVKSRKTALSHRLEFLCELLGGEAVTHNEYPEWAYREKSHLRDVLCETYEEQTGKKMKIEAIHAGLECGLFDDKKPGMDMISIGPDMRDIHSAKERLSISSVERTWKLVCAVLKKMK